MNNVLKNKILKNKVLKEIGIVLVGLLGELIGFFLILYLLGHSFHVRAKDREIIDSTYVMAQQMAQDRLKEKYGLDGTIVECEPGLGLTDYLSTELGYLGYFLIKIKTGEDIITMEVYPEEDIVYDDYQAELFCDDFKAYFLENMDIPTPYSIDVSVSGGNEDDYSFAGLEPYNGGLLEGYYLDHYFFEAVPRKYGEWAVPYIHIHIKYIDEKGDLQEIFSPQLKEMFGEYPVYVSVSNYKNEAEAKEGVDSITYLKSYYDFERQVYGIDPDEYYRVY